MDVKIGISVAIITRNEAETVSRALDSVTGIADKIILVDSGSDDSTLPLAKQHPARPKIYEKEWNDDFSELRNYAISLCSFPYCVMLDADEYIKKECRKDFRETIINAMRIDDNLLFAPVIDNLNGTILKNNSRIFKIRKNLSYKGRVHEYLHSEQANQIAYLPELIINHTGYHKDVYIKKQKRKKSKTSKKADCRRSI